jgi:hypothetical protein
MLTALLSFDVVVEDDNDDHDDGHSNAHYDDHNNGHNYDLYL